MSRVFPRKALSVDPRFTGGAFTNPVQNIADSLPWIVFVNNDVVPWTIVLTLKAGPSLATTYDVQPGAIHSWPTKPYITVNAPLPPGGTAGDFQYFYSEVEIQVTGLPVTVGGVVSVAINTVASWLFGTGSDGAVVMDGSNTFPFATLAGSDYTLTRDIQTTSLTVNAGIVLGTGTGGFRIFCQGSVINQGTISGGGGGSSGAGGAVANGSPGGNGTISTYGFQAGGGGGGGASGSATPGGAGGIGGGIVWICAVDIVNLGNIFCNGLAGANAATGVGDKGGGGGGGGGACYLGYARTLIGSAFIDVASGAGGNFNTGSGTGSYNGGSGGASANTATGGAGGIQSTDTQPTVGNTGQVGGGGGGGGFGGASDSLGAAGGNGTIVTQLVSGL